MWQPMVGLLSSLSLGAAPQAAEQVRTVSLESRPAAEAGNGVFTAWPARLTIEDVSLEEGLMALRDRSGAPVSFSPSRVHGYQVSCACAAATVGEALDRMLAQTPFHYVETAKRIMVRRTAEGSNGDPAPSTAPPRAGPQAVSLSLDLPVVPRAKRLIRQGVVTGQVTDAATGQPLASAQVQISGTPLGTVTDADGRFRIPNVPDGEIEVRVELLGYALATQLVSVETDATVTVDFQLEQQALPLDELVVVGYTTQARRTIAGSVTSVQASEIAERQVATIQDALRGRMPGVNVRNSGQPGETAVVDIRGRAFTEDNSPLYVVDGMYLSNLRNLNPNDVESIQVLKDASAASQYGAQAANGVVIITTRRGRASDGNRVSLRSSYGYSEMARTIPMMNAQEWAELTLMKYENARAIDPTSPTVPAGVFDVLEGRNTIDTDWQAEATQPGRLQDHVLSVSGGTLNGDASYLVSGGYTDQRGTLLDTDFERLTLRVNSQIRRGRLTLGENIMLSRSDRSNPTTPEQGQLGEALRMLPPIPVRNTDGTHGNDDWGHGTANYPTFALNPVGGAELVNQTFQQNEAFGTLFGEVEIIPGLNYRLNVGFRYNDTKGDIFQRTGTIRQNTEPGDAILDVSSALATSLLLENLVSLNRSIGRHNINATVGYTQNRQKTDSVSAIRAAFVDENLRVLPGGTDLREGNNQSKSESRLNSYLARVSYSLADRYIAELSFRRDGSSRFGPINRWGNFYAGSLGWVMSDEPFFRDIPVLRGADFLKLRASYGTQGNQDFADYEWQATVTSTDQAYILGPGEGSIQPGSIVTGLSNPEVRWQDNSMQNYGIDVGLFDNRLSITAEYYISRSGGLLARVPLVQSIGSAVSPFVNAGSIQNKGFEFSIRHAYSRPGFQLNTGLNLSTIDSKVLSLGGGDADIIDGAARTAVGLPLGHFWLHETCGIFQTQEEVDAHGSQPNAGPGDLCFVDDNGDGQIDSFDRHFAGSPWPDFEAGFFVDGTFRRFDFNLGLRASYGAKVFNAIRPALEDMTGDNNAPKWLDPWTPDDPSTTAPRPLWGGVGADNARGPSDRYLEDGSYLKIQNVQLGYSVPESLLDRVGLEIERARVYLNVQDIHTFTSYLGWDPEFRGGTLTPGVDGGTRYPNPRTFTVGIDLSLGGRATS